tara:strand:- start:198 stop:812 length:615 start_codon:yes stop_codon:yes gene_type:complete
MAFDTYTNLKTALANFLARDDLTTHIPDFISLAEARMSRELDTRSQEKRATATLTSASEFVSLPTDLRAIRLVKINSNPIKVLDYNSPENYYEKYPNNQGGNPEIYTIVGAEIGFRPIPSSSLTAEIIYGEDISALSDSNLTNTILTRHPDAYLYGSLSQAYIFLMDENRVAQYDTLFTRVIEEIKKDTQTSRFSSGALAMQQA